LSAADMLYGSDMMDMRELMLEEERDFTRGKKNSRGNSQKIYSPHISLLSQ